MSKRLICTERPLAALGREDVMKRVFFLSLCREKPAAGFAGGSGGMVDLGSQGVDVASGTAAAAPTTRHPFPRMLRLLLTGPLQRIVMYLVTREQEQRTYGPEPCAIMMGRVGRWGAILCGETCLGTCLLSALIRLWG